MLALIEGELDPAREAAVVAGLDAAQARMVRAMQRHRSLLLAAPEVPAPPGLIDRVGRVLEREAVTGPALDAGPFQLEVHRRSSWPGRLAVAAGLALMAGGLGYWSLRLSGTTPTGPKIAIAPGETEPSPDAVAIAHQPAETAARAPAENPAGPTSVAIAEDDDIPEMSLVDFTDPLVRELEPYRAGRGGSGASLASAFIATREELAGPAAVPLGVFPDVPTSLDFEDAAQLAEEGRLVIRVRADRPALAAARLLAQADSRADKGRLWRLMPCPPPDFSMAVESAMPPVRTIDGAAGLTVPYRSPIRPTVETTLSVELDPSVPMMAIVQAELESISEGAVILDVLERPVTMAPPCSDEGGLRRWTSAPSSAVHSVVVPLVVEGE